MEPRHASSMQSMLRLNALGGLCFLLFQANLLLLWYMNYERFVENNG